MAYNESSMRAHLMVIGDLQWLWAGDHPDVIRKEVLARNPAAADRSRGPFEEIAEYCWQAYSKSYGSRGDMVIGRVPHLKAGKMYEKLGEMTEKETLFDEMAQGNILQMDKWAPIVNDSWILGGVHRQALFRLASPRLIENLWNFNGYFVVTAREILGLLHFGYVHEQAGPWQIMVCKDPLKAQVADLVQYDAVIAKGQTVLQALRMFDRQGSSARAAQQVQDFRNRLADR